MVKPLRIGVIGVGYLGRIHARIYANMPEVDLVAVVDADAGTANTVADELGCRAATESLALVGCVDAVSVVVPTSSHEQVACPYLDAGIHVMLEKPIAASVEQGRRIITSATRSGAILQIGHLERFNSGFRVLAERVHSPRFIEVHRLGAFVERATDVDVVTDLMIHDIDIVLHLVPSQLHSVVAVGTAVITEQVDIANARLQFCNGAVANITASRVSDKRFRRIRVFSDGCYHALDFTNQQIDIVKPGIAEPGVRFPPMIRESLRVEAVKPLDAELEHFIQTIRSGGQPSVGGEEGLAALAVVERVLQEIKT